MDKFEEILLNNIELRSNIYNVSFSEKSNTLTQSINKIGLINPITLYKEGNVYTVVCGHRRLSACTELKFNSLSARILENTFSPIDLLTLNIEDNTQTRIFNLIEKATIIDKLLNQLKLPIQNVVKTFLPLIGIPANEKYIDNYLFIHTLSNELKNLIISNNLSIEAIKKILELPANIQVHIFDLILSFKLGSNKTAETINLLVDLSQHSISKLDSILDDPEWTQIKNDVKIPDRQKGQYFRNILIKRRFPEYSNFREKAKKIISKLNLPKNISLDIEELLTWENDSITLKLNAHDNNELNTLSKNLLELSKSNDLQELFKLLRCS